MQIQPSFWVKLRRLYAQHLEQDESLRIQINSTIERIQASARADQHQMMANLFSTLGRLPNAVELGFQIGRNMPMTAYGTLSLGALTAPTVRDTLRFIANAHYLQAPLINLSFEETASVGRFTIGFRCPIDNAAEALIVAMCTASIEREIARNCGRTNNLSQLELTPSSKEAKAIYRKSVSLMPHTNGTCNTLVFERAVLDLPNIHADIDTFNSVVDACVAQTELQACGASLQHQVREVIMSEIGDPPALERLAKTLRLTPRQLRAGLDRENTNYQVIIRECRTEYASVLFKNPSLSLSQIAYRLGYSDLSAFSHSFYRWTGKSPSAFRMDIFAQRAA